MSKMNNKLSELKNLKANLKGNSFYTKKSLGQNFLVNDEIALEIVSGAEVCRDDIVLEIGPGVGSLTRYIADRAKMVIAVEIDTKAIPLLEKNTKDLDNVRIINDDILKVDLGMLLGDVRGNIKVVANLPYYITSPIIMYLLESEINFHSITVMVQKEVGDRLLASPGTKDYGVLTLAVSYYAIVEKIVDVGRENFHPVPKVDSVVVRLLLKSKIKRLSKKEESNLFKLIKAGFNMRRKNLLNSFKNLFEGNKEEVREFLDKAGIDGNRRGETLSLEEYIMLSKIRSN